MSRKGRGTSHLFFGVPPLVSIWGKIIGGVAGFALGGPIGALLGTAAGYERRITALGAEIARLKAGG